MKLSTPDGCPPHVVIAALVLPFLMVSVSCQNLGPSTQPEAYFNGSSYLRLQTTISLKKQTALSFRSCFGGGLFSQQQNDNLLELLVTAEGVVFNGKTAGKQYEDKILGNFLNNKWHTVQMRYVLGNVTIEVDGESRLVANSTYRSELLTSSGLYNEGSAVLLIGKQFNGCLREGPSLAFHNSIITSSPNVVFEECPIPEDNCVPRENYKGHDYCANQPCMGQGTCVNGLKDYTCSCFPGYTGKNCEIDMKNPCEKNPQLCKNGATCSSDNAGSYSCACPPEFTGKNCENKMAVQRACKDNPCQNGASCTHDANGQMECSCVLGFKGERCELNEDDCKPNICRNGGVCEDGLHDFTCNCSGTGYQGRLCNVNVNECLQSPCLNHGICFDTYGGYICQCPPGYGGSNCQNSLNECLSQPCLNHGVCSDQPDGGYSCHCAQGFTGERCETEHHRQCDTTLCPPYTDCIIVGDVVQCVCKPEYLGVHPNCSTDTGCLNNPCKNGGVCTPWKDTFNCTCPPNYKGKFCQVVVDGCASVSCLNGGVCVVDQLTGSRCNCTDQWMGKHCDRPYDACELKPCFNNATCVASLKNKRDFACNCPAGFEGALCDVNIDNCVEVACPVGEKCHDLVDGYECRCPPGYAGENCTVDLDPCAKGPCSHGATCQVDKSTHEFSCSCPPGFTGALCEIDVDECRIPGPPICNQGICVNKEGGFQCYCMPGYTGERCNLDFNECLSRPCQNNATCLNQVNNFECICTPGYAGKDCSIDVNECDSSPCTEGSTCVDGINNYACICQPGLTGRRCEINIDDCESSPCLNDAQCIDGLNSYTCNCSDTGYTGVHCEINIDDCVGDPCQHGAECVDDVKDYHCKCFPGYTGKNCEEDVNECESNPCKWNGTCYEKSDERLYGSNFAHELPEAFNKTFTYEDAAGYVCLCVVGVTGDNCEININECESSPCFQGTCVDEIGGYHCECDDGYEGPQCDVDIDECEKYRPCAHGKCLDRKANYFCDCEPSYGGKNCSVELVGCVDDPCLNNGTCRPYLVDETVHRFNCSCPNGYHGQMCEKISTMSFAGDSMVAVNTTREEGYDIQFRFKTTLGDGLLALGKGVTFYILELSKGRLNLHTSLLNKWEGVFIGSNLNDSGWQRVFVAINSTHLVVSANDEQSIYPISFNENNSNTSFPVTYIGGIPGNLRKLTHGPPYLVGCTEDVHINGEWVLPGDKSPWMTFENVTGGCLREEQCNPNPCHSGGHCTDMWRKFSCTCERPYLGHTCQYNFTAATFGYENITDSLVTVTVADSARRAVRTIVDISMFVRTRQPRGQIFYLGSALGSTNQIDETYIAAQLEGGELLVRIQFNGTPEAYTVGGVKLNDGYNHLIEVIRNYTLVQVKLNGTEYFRKTISATGTLDAQVLFLGGQPQLRPVRQVNDNMVKIEAVPPTASAAVTTPLSNIHFKGIIQDVQISNGSSVMVVEFFPLQVEDLEMPMAFGDVTFDNTTVLEGVRSDDSCRINPCLHHGVCKNTWNDYRCDCPRGFKGKDCTDLEFCELEECPSGSECKNLENGRECLANVSFDGKTMPLRYKFVAQSNSTKSMDSLEIKYRTRSWGTLLFAKNLDDYFVVFVYHNHIVLEWRMDKITNSRRFRKDRFEGQWLTLYFTHRDSVFTGGFKEMVVDESPNFEVLNFNFNAFENIWTNGTVYVGGSDGETFDFRSAIENTDNNITGYIPVSDTTTMFPMTNSIEMADSYPQDVYLYKVDQNKATDLFKGCLGEIRVGGLLLPVFNTAVIYKNKIVPFNEYFNLVYDTKPPLGCTLCYKADCFNNGSCVSPAETYRCNCYEGFAADDCSVDIDECQNNQCQNNATCVDLIAKYECHCLPGYDGLYCENDIDECLSDPCRHGGTCRDEIATFKCECPEDFVGKQCEAPLLITCDNEPCAEGATCLQGHNATTGNNFTCVCAEGMEGPLCDTPFCKTRPCIQGECNITSDVPSCLCLRGFDGKFCERDIDDCGLPSVPPCQNGGTCIDGINRFDCNCNGTGYQGLLCEMDIDECNNTMACGGRGRCENKPGTYECHCEEKGKCGHFCALYDICETEKPCEHGECASKCFAESEYVCNCDEEYSGKNCTEHKLSASQSEGGVNILYIVLPIILIILIALLIVMAVLVNVARSKRATRGTYSPSAQEFCNPRVELDHVLKPPPEERLI